VDRFAVGEKYDPEVSVLGLGDRRPSANAAIGLDYLPRGGANGSFNPFVEDERTVRSGAKGLEVSGGLHTAKVTGRRPGCGLTFELTGPLRHAAKRSE